MNNNKKYLLTIGIPIYNGERFIQQTLNSIFVDNKEFLQTVEVVVSDNCSTDNTAKIIKEYNKTVFGKIKYFKNESNFGYDKNVDLVVKRATGKYVWFLGCGEILEKNVLNGILQYLNNKNFSHILLNFKIFSEEKKCLETENNYEIFGNKEFDNFDDYIGYIKGAMSALSTNVVNRLLYLNVMKSPLLVTGWIHLERIIDLCKLDDNFYASMYAPVCFQLLRDKNGWWTKKGQFFSMNLFMAYIFYKKGLMSFYDKKTWKQWLSLLIHAKKNGLMMNNEILRIGVDYFRYNFLLLIVFMLILMMPNIFFKTRIFKLYAQIYRKIKLFSI